MSTFPNFTQLLKGVIVLPDVAVAVRRIIVFHYNPEEEKGVV
jgi:hypothetical protein